MKKLLLGIILLVPIASFATDYQEGSQKVKVYNSILSNYLELNEQITELGGSSDSFSTKEKYNFYIGKQLETALLKKGWLPTKYEKDSDIILTMSSSKGSDYEYADWRHSDCVSNYSANIKIESIKSGKVRNIKKDGGLTFSTFPGWSIYGRRLTFGVCVYRVSAIENAIKEI